MNPHTQENLSHYLKFSSESIPWEVKSVPHFYTLPEGKIQLQHLQKLSHAMNQNQILRKLGGVSSHLQMHQTEAQLPYLLAHRDDTEEIVAYNPLVINPDVERRKEGLAEVLYDLQRGITTIDSLATLGKAPTEHSFNLHHFWVDLIEGGLQTLAPPAIGCRTTTYTTVPREKASWYVTFIVRHHFVQNLSHLIRMELAYKIHQSEHLRDINDAKSTGQGYFKIEGASLSNLTLRGRASYFDFPQKKAIEGIKILPNGVVRRESNKHREMRFSSFDRVLEQLLNWVESPPEQVVQKVADLEYIF